jgi:hypothetical protein
MLAAIQFSIVFFYLPNPYLKIKVMCVVLYWRVTWSSTVREEHGFRVSESTVLRRIFGPEGEKITEDCRR